jgi:hypothetical protein
LNRYARSLFIPNYDLEFQTLRELHYGMNPSATGAVLRLGGSLTRTDMEKSLKILFDRLDDSGSLFWWPRAVNKKRCLTRCSQGQGAWLQHSYDQWMGLRMDGVNHTLAIRPQGLVNSYCIRAGHIGGFIFDIEWEEIAAKSRFYVKNLNAVSFTIIFGARPYGAGSEGELTYGKRTLAAGESVEICISVPSVENAVVENVCAKEGQLLGKNKTVFGPFGLVMPKLYSGSCPVFMLRFVVLNDSDRPWEDTTVTLSVPEKWYTAPKETFHWDYDPVFKENKTVVFLGKVECRKHYTAGFYVLLPQKFTGDHNSVLLSRHMFRKPCNEDDEPPELIVRAEEQADLAPISARLQHAKGYRDIELPVRVLPGDEYKKKFDKMLHGFGSDGTP